MAPRAQQQALSFVPQQQAAPPRQRNVSNQQCGQQSGGSGNFLNGFSNNTPSSQPQRQMAQVPVQQQHAHFQQKPANTVAQQRRDRMDKEVEENVVPGLGGPNRHPPGGAKPVTGAKQSTRVQQTPGGTSSIVIG